MKKLLLLSLLALSGAAHGLTFSNLYDLRFLRADVNSDGALTPDEFLATQPGTVKWVDAMHRFAAADTNGDGVLSITEFRASRGGVRGGRATRYEAFQSADLDHDGKLSPSEYALTEPQNRSSRLLLNAFGRKDKNGDGFLSLREFGILVIPR